MASPTDGADLEASLLSFEKLDRASPDLWPEQLPGVAEFAASFKSPITSSPPKWMAEIERDDIDMLKELGSLTTANLMEKVRGLQNLAYQLGLDECLSLLWPLLLRSTGSGRAGPAAMAHRPSRSTACRILPDRGTNPRPLHQQADSQPLRHQGSPSYFLDGILWDTKV
ncbi:protein lin-52 homolog isoform X1 [Physeter macrocephalus]|uniref:Protein lin-52 homolog n=1 Tax=Physeter macrocephalus TaxID=9755 RepID=A0A9W2WZE1_PHYMC|nr:protein lin-52 homolog isoform X1 [Physeter catodon]